MLISAIYNYGNSSKVDLKNVFDLDPTAFST